MKGIRARIFPILMQITKIRIRYNLLKIGILTDDADRSCIFAVNHTNSADIPMALRALGHNCKVLLGKQLLFLSDRLFFLLNGVIWVDRKNKPDMQRTKEKLIIHLRKNNSVIWFPKGTWNQTDNLLMLPMKWGIIDVAQKAKVNIVPIALDYDKENNICTASIGDVIDPNRYTLSERITHLRDSMATLRWNLWESKGIFQRSKLDIVQERAAFEQDMMDYPMVDPEYEQSVIFCPPDLRVAETEA